MERRRFSHSIVTLVICCSLGVNTRGATDYGEDGGDTDGCQWSTVISHQWERGHFRVSLDSKGRRFDTRKVSEYTCGEQLISTHVNALYLTLPYLPERVEPCHFLFPRFPGSFLLARPPRESYVHCTETESNIIMVYEYDHTSLATL